MRIRMFLPFILLIISISVNAQEIYVGKIVSVPDGDTVILLTEKKEQIKVRLNGIDCPERGQDYGTKATEFTKNLCDGKKIAVDKVGIDQYDRVLGVVWANGVNVNEALLENGLAWQYKHNDNKRYADLVSKAKEKKLNIWSMPNPVAPWDFRNSK